MKAILLAAGLGTRLKPLTDIWPKCLMPIQGRPLLEYWLDDFQKLGLNEIVINTHHHPEIVAEFLRRPKFGTDLIVAYEQELLGTAGTLRRNGELLAGDSILVAHADNWCRCDLEDFLRFHFNGRPAGTEITMMTFETTNPESCGIVEIDDSGVVRGFHEKVTNPPGNLANAAVYIIEPCVLEWLRSRPEVCDFSTGVLPEFVGRIATWKNSGVHRDIGTIAELRSAQRDLVNPAAGLDDPWQDAFRRHPIQQYVQS